MSLGLGNYKILQYLISAPFRSATLFRRESLIRGNTLFLHVLFISFLNFFIYWLIQIFFYCWYTKTAEGNEFQQKNILNYTNIKLNIVVKLVYLQIKHSQSIIARFLILVLNSKTEFLDLTLSGRLFHVREPLKWIAFVP